MNRIFIVISIIFIFLTFFIIDEKIDKNKKDAKVENVMENRAMYVSYVELQDYVRDAKDSSESKKNIINILDNTKSLGFNWIILHVRSHSDAIYKSAIFPWSYNVSAKEGVNPGYDILQFFIDEGHKRGIEIHAWINPYRVRGTEDISSITESNPAYKYLNTNIVKVIEGKGIWYNPASNFVTNLIVDGIKELVINYDIDGVHFDDYFYPDYTIDNENYNDYFNNGGQLTIADFRLDNVTRLIREVYLAIKEINPNVLFGIAPEGNIENNYDENYLDVKKILSKPGYVDYIMPQLYYGFTNEVKPFIATINIWNDLIKVDKIKLMPALAFYKVGKVDQYAKGGNLEWVNNSDIIKKQIIVSRQMSHYGGVAIFSYNHIFNPKYKGETTFFEFENMKAVLD